jgi:hypothetical protein
MLALLEALRCSLEMIECPKDVLIGEDAKLEVEHRVNVCESEERTSK